jgi:hypothetical protein
VRYEVSPLMMAHEVDCELAGDDAQVIWTCKDTMRVYEDDLTDNAKSFNETMGKTRSYIFHTHVPINIFIMPDDTIIITIINTITL